VTVEGNSITFRQTIVFDCNGKEQLEMPAGSIVAARCILASSDGFCFG